MYSAFPLKEAVLFLLAFWAGKNYSSRACTVTNTNIKFIGVNLKSDLQISGALAMMA